MPDCEILSTCIFFNDKMNNAPDMAEYQKKKYCISDKSKCARYKVYRALGREKVPKDLFPFQIDKVDQIVEKG